MFFLVLVWAFCFCEIEQKMSQFFVEMFVGDQWRFLVDSLISPGFKWMGDHPMFETCS